MELELLDKKIRRLVTKLNKHNVHLEVFDHEDIAFGRVLGRGGEGVVRECTVTYNDLPVDGAVKTLLDNSDDCINITLDEIELLCLAKDPIIQTTLRVYGVAAVPDTKNHSLGRLVIITEAGLMNALQLVQQEILSRHVLFRLFGDVAAGIHTLHAKNIIHHDIKPENILIASIVRDCMGTVEQASMRIIDLGMGKRVFTEKVVCDDIMGTNGYHPPEILFDDFHDFRADIFMLGVTFAIMCHSQDFLKSPDLLALLKNLHAAKQRKVLGKALFEEILEPTLKFNMKLSKTFKNMLCTMMEHVDKRNITLVDVVDICRHEADKALRDGNLIPPVLSPCLNGQDSGIDNRPGSNDTSDTSVSTSTTSSAQSSSRRQLRPRRARSRATRSCSTPVGATPVRATPVRTRKRKTSEISEESIIEVEADGTPMRKRLRLRSSPHPIYRDYSPDAGDRTPLLKRLRVRSERRTRSQATRSCSTPVGATPVRATPVRTRKRKTSEISEESIIEVEADGTPMRKRLRLRSSPHPIYRDYSPDAGDRTPLLKRLRIRSEVLYYEY